MTTAERKIAAYRAKRKERPHTKVIRETVTVFNADVSVPLFPTFATLDIFPDGTITLNGTTVLKGELPAWAKKYVIA